MMKVQRNITSEILKNCVNSIIFNENSDGSMICFGNQTLKSINQKKNLFWGTIIRFTIFEFLQQFSTQILIFTQRMLFNINTFIHNFPLQKISFLVS